jgi:hypothetical protein
VKNNGSQALTPREVSWLMSTVGSGFRRARGNADMAKMFSIFLLIASVPIAFGALIPAVVMASLGVLGTAASLVAAANHDVEVLAMIRDCPSEIIELVETKSGITVVTRTTSARCSTPDREELLVQLAKYCRNARVTLT